MCNNSAIPTSLVCFGLNIQTAPLQLLEKISLSHACAEQFLSCLAEDEAIREVVVLSTCNRVEFYIAAPSADDACEALVSHLRAFAELQETESLRASAYIHIGDAAAEHVFRVAAGLDSLIIGEAQILGQLRRAFDLARSLGTCGEHLNSLLNRAISFGRRVRTETAIGRGNVSVASVASNIAIDKLGTLSDKEVLILGAGETALLAGRHLVKESVGRLRVLNRKPENARAMAAELGGEAVPIDHLQSAVASADVVVCAVGAPHYIISKEGVERTMFCRPCRPLLMIDLSMPRNIDPEVGKIKGVTLYSLDNLEEIARGNRENREAEIITVEGLVKKETLRYADWAATSLQNQLVTTLRRNVAAIQQRNLERYHANEEPAIRQKLMLFSDAVVRAAFHDVTEYIRGLDLDTETGRQDYETMKRLFALSESAVAKETGAQLVS